jgi:diacylglycerol kinase family enzyme
VTATVLLNRDGGAVARDPDIAAKASRALDAAGIEAKVELIDGADTQDRARAAAEQEQPLLIVGGGDGTISAAASALAGTGTALGILPLGTLNHFARDLDIPNELDAAATLIASGLERRVDVAELNGEVFINNSAIGIYPLMVVDREAQQKRLGRSKRLAMVVASLRTLVRFRHQRLALTINDEAQARVDTPLLFVGNNDYRIDLGAAGQRASLEDGQLCVLVMRKKTRAGLIAATIRALLNRSRPDDLVRIDGVERLGVASHRRRLTVSLDGEVISAAPPLDYRIRKQALRVIAPRA